jgi:hypothetical protein
MIGIRTAYITTADQLFTSDAALATVGLTSPIAAGQTQKFRAWIPFSVGATGGINMQILAPAAGVIFIASITLNNTVAPSQTIATQTASAAFGAAVANAGTHWVEIEGTIVNGVNAGNIDIQIAQNSSDALSLTVLRGAEMEVTKF